MKTNSNVCLYGRHVLLIPYLPEHVATRYNWLKLGGNRLDRSPKPPILEQEKAMQVKYLCNAKHCIFLVADTEIHNDPESSEADSLIGEVHLLMSEQKDGKGAGHAFVEIMLTDRSVRRRSLICESLLLLLLYGVDVLKLSQFSVMIDPAAEQTDNRLIFVPRDDSDIAAPPPTSTSASKTPPHKLSTPKSPPHKLSTPTASPQPNKKNIDAAPKSPKRKPSVLKSMKKAFSKSKTDYLNTLTRHLLQEDEGQHWPVELDFECVESTRIMLTMTQESAKSLFKMVAQAKRIKYSSIIGNGAVRDASCTRIDGQSLVLIPYGSEHVKLVHSWMQLKEMYTGFEVPPPSMTQETEAQKMMERDGDCHPFIVCSKVGSEDNLLFPEGRGQLLVTAQGVAQLHIVLAQNPDITVKTSMMRETLLMLMFYARQVLPVQRLWMIAATAVRPKADAKKRLWNARLDFAPNNNNANHLELDIESNAVKIVLRGLTKGMVRRKYFKSEIVYDQGSVT